MNRGSFGLYEPCGGDEVSEEVFAVVVAIEELKEALQRSTMASKERKIEEEEEKEISRKFPNLKNPRISETSREFL